MKYRIYTKEDKDKVLKLFETGSNQSAISRETGVPRETLREWLKPKDISKRIRNSYVPIINFDEYLNTEEKRRAYSFLLAIYLCDGYVCKYKTLRAPSLRMFNDSRYPINIQEWANKAKIIFPNNSIKIFKKKSSNSCEILLYSKKILDLFPQHGPGKKHSRKLNFENWQMQIVKEYPEEFIRACIQSDGCIYHQKLKNGNYSYKRYNFVNKSEDIMNLFAYALSVLGIIKEKTFNKSRNLFVVQNFSKEDTQILEKIISKKE